MQPQFYEILGDINQLQYLTQQNILEDFYFSEIFVLKTFASVARQLIKVCVKDRAITELIYFYLF